MVLQLLSYSVESELESEVQQRIQEEASRNGITLMRNNSGSLKDITGRSVRFGLGNISKKHNSKLKSSDLIGIEEVTITADMVGQKFGRFWAVEVKEPDWKYTGTEREVAQKKFIDLIISKGGRACFIKSLADFKKFVSNISFTGN